LRGHLSAGAFRDHAIIAKAPAEIRAICDELDAARVAHDTALQDGQWRCSSPRVEPWRDMTWLVAMRRATAGERKAPDSYSGGCSFSGGVAVVSRWAKRADLGCHRSAVPGDTTSAELYPARELPGLLEPRDMYAMDRLQAFVVDEPKVGHRFALEQAGHET
jgi:hypothetical protein